MSSWKTVNLGEICEIERGGSPRPISEFVTNDEDGVNWIKITDATASGKCIYATEEKIIPEGVKRSRMVYPGDFILSNSMSFGRPYIMQTSGCIHDGWLVLRKPNADTDFLYYILSSEVVSNQFESLAAGSTVRNLNVQIAKEVKIPLPPLAEQRKIAEILRTWDEAIETAEAELKAKQERKRGLVGRLVGACGEVVSHARSMWPLVALSNFAKSKSGDSTLIKGKLFKEPGPGLFPAYSATGQDVWRDAYAHDMTAIVVSAVGARCGRTFIACGKWSAIANTQVILPDLAKVEPYYLNLFLNDEKFWVRGGSAQPFVVPSKTLKKKIPLPPLAEQQKIVNILMDADVDIELINDRINALRAQKRGLMQKLLTGEVRVAA